MRSTSLQQLVDQLRIPAYENRDVDLGIARHALAARRECLMRSERRCYICWITRHLGRWPTRSEC